MLSGSSASAVAQDRQLADLGGAGRAAGEVVGQAAVRKRLDIALGEGGQALRIGMRR